MFLAGVLKSSGLSSLDPDEERDPPEQATPITFPTYPRAEPRTWSHDEPPPDFHALFSRMVRPVEITEKHFEAFNINFLPDGSIEDLVPSSHMPPLWDPEARESEDPIISRKRKEFDERIAELRVDNDTGFRVINRTTQQGTKVPRLAYLRKFWEGLENMAQYWDESVDQYYEVANESEEGGSKGAKRQRLECDAESASNEQAAQQGQTSSDVNGSAEIQSLQVANDPPTTDTTSTSPPNHPLPETPTGTPDPSNLRYKGRRTGTGRAMPDQFRSETLKGFLEGSSWPFQLTLLPPRFVPRVHIGGTLNFPVRQTAQVWRMPAERLKARQGGVVGPLAGVQARGDTDFPLGDEVRGRLDLLREVGALLHIAQERRREGRTEVRPGTGKWWTMAPRWGGGEGGEMEKEVVESGGVSEEVGDAEKEKERKAKLEKEKEREARKGRTRKTPAMMWKEVRPGASQWDAKAEYLAIGREAGSEYDEVFLISSLNTHICLLKLTVHSAYLDYLSAPHAIPDPPPADPEWCRPKLQRSEWEDLFAEEGRVAAFRALWGLWGWMGRDQGGG